MKKALALSIGTFIAFALPLVSSAVAVNNFADVGQFIINFISNILVPVIFALAFIVFIWGAFQAFIVGATSDEAATKGKNLMLWGLIGFFVMVSIWGLVNILTGTFQFGNNVAPSSVPTSGVNVRGI